METINCPNCGHEFHLENALATTLKAEYDQKLVNARKQLLEDQRKKENELMAKEAQFEEKRARENELFKAKLEKAKKEQENILKAQILDQYELKINDQKQAIEEQAKQLKGFQQQEIELIKLQRQLKDAEQSAALKYERQLQMTLNSEEEKIVKREAQRWQLKEIEYQQKIEQQKKLAEEMQRKAQQGSMQIQGEVQELAIESILKNQYPFDDVTEVPKGIRGADCIHTVKNEQMQSCGTIIYESKRTKSFGGDWVSKLKNDQRTAKADMAVLITQVLPKDIDGFGQIDDVWICDFSTFENLSNVLRQILIKLSEVRHAQLNKGDKIELLYNFLTSEEFKLQMTGIVDGWKQMKDDLEKEKRSIQSLWKKREKQLDLVIDNAINMYSSIRGIAGRAIPTIQHLELPDGE